MHLCPKCNSEEIHRSRARSKWESWRKEITGRRPYRCHACGWRGWGLDSGPKFDQAQRELASRVLVPDPPNLKGTALAHDEGRPQDLALEDLDVLGPTGNGHK